MHRFKIYKIQMCKYALINKCDRGENCTFAHDISELRIKPDMRKTKLCKSYILGKCTDHNCIYAHSVNELREVGKPAICQLHREGRCIKGNQCRFAHSINDINTKLVQFYEENMHEDEMEFSHLNRCLDFVNQGESSTLNRGSDLRSEELLHLARQEKHREWKLSVNFNEGSSNSSSASNQHTREKAKSANRTNNTSKGMNRASLIKNSSCSAFLNNNIPNLSSRKEEKKSEVLLRGRNGKYTKLCAINMSMKSTQGGVNRYDKELLLQDDKEDYPLEGRFKKMNYPQNRQQHEGNGSTESVRQNLTPPFNSRSIISFNGEESGQNRNNCGVVDYRSGTSGEDSIYFGLGKNVDAMGERSTLRLGNNQGGTTRGKNFPPGDVFTRVRASGKKALSSESTTFKEEKKRSQANADKGDGLIHSTDRLNVRGGVSWEGKGYPMEMLSGNSGVDRNSNGGRKVPHYVLEENLSNEMKKGNGKDNDEEKFHLARYYESTLPISRDDMCDFMEGSLLRLAQTNEHVENRNACSTCKTYLDVDVQKVRGRLGGEKGQLDRGSKSGVIPRMSSQNKTLNVRESGPPNGSIPHKGSTTCLPEVENANANGSSDQNGVSKEGSAEGLTRYGSGMQGGSNSQYGSSSTVDMCAQNVDEVFFGRIEESGIGSACRKSGGVIRDSMEKALLGSHEEKKGNPPDAAHHNELLKYFEEMQQWSGCSVLERLQTEDGNFQRGVSDDEHGEVPKDSPILLGDYAGAKNCANLRPYNLFSMFRQKSPDLRGLPDNCGVKSASHRCVSQDEVLLGGTKNDSSDHAGRKDLSSVRSVANQKKVVEPVGGRKREGDVPVYSLVSNGRNNPTNSSRYRMNVQSDSPGMNNYHDGCDDYVIHSNEDKMIERENRLLYRWLGLSSLSESCPMGMDTSGESPLLTLDDEESYLANLDRTGGMKNVLSDGKDMSCWSKRSMSRRRVVHNGEDSRLKSKEEELYHSSLDNIPIGYEEMGSENIFMANYSWDDKEERLVSTDEGAVRIGNTKEKKGETHFEKSDLYDDLTERNIFSTRHLCEGGEANLINDLSWGGPKWDDQKWDQVNLEPFDRIHMEDGSAGGCDNGLVGSNAHKENRSDRGRNHASHALTGAFLNYDYEKGIEDDVVRSFLEESNSPPYDRLDSSFFYDFHEGGNGRPFFSYGEDGALSGKDKNSLYDDADAAAFDDGAFCVDLSKDMDLQFFSQGG
ncbi:Uncharacterized protein PCOAH_00015090 [Plasmodium coatneyi]|uniref:C3H1-type domain-containing protein n=1 Tax=Plasmodium coatneyi TaxID=208452 RepID=A0A1B1DWL7_9APIC|nr:Uncharacterized protein PCOAH_00015090 [Plasmodium coatneyi]ANQ07201.1 Uncharacterized protein PCOAH_00015090 [Plasmodium coatneyi]